MNGSDGTQESERIVLCRLAESAKARLRAGGVLGVAAGMWGPGVLRARAAREMAERLEGGEQGGCADYERTGYIVA